MFDFLKNIIGGISNINYKELVADGAIIVDVRTPAEYNSGHIKGSINIPLQTLQSNISKLDKNKTVITCCASGMRSASAKAMLKAAGFEEVHNAGAWTSLQNHL